MKYGLMRCASALAMAVGVSGWSAALAQDVDQTEASGPQESGPQTSREVVVVTASKREETVQDIAVAVTAITSELRDEIGLTTVQDYTNFAPGLTYSTSNDRLGMRGVTRTSNNFGIRSGISNYVDGVYYSSAIPASREPIFVERVEVVRGPQGTLYGRDSIGGALNVISKRPSDEFEGQFNVGVGNFESRKMEARISGPITDWLRYDIAGSRSIQDEGNLTNASGLESEGYRTDGYFLQAQLEGDIGENFEWWTRYARLQWDKIGAPGARTSAGDQQPYDTRFIPPGSNWPNGAFAFSGAATNVNQVGTQTTNPTDDRTFNTDYTNLAHLEPTHEITLEAIYHMPQFDIKYLGGYVYYHYNLTQDSDGYPVKSFDFGGRTYLNERISDYNENRAWLSNEINLISNGDGPFQWVTGLYQYQENYSQPIFVSEQGNIGGSIQALNDVLAFNFFNPLVELPDFTGRNSFSGSQIGGDLYFHTNNEAINNAYGAFLQTDYQFNDQWKVTAGVRWSKDVMNGRETARLIDHYVTEAALQAGLAPFAGLVGGQAVLNALVQPRIDVTTAIGGPDPTTVNASNPCGFAGLGVVNINTSVAPNNCADRTRYGIYVDPATGNHFRDIEASWNEVTGVIGLDFTPDADTLIYGKYNRGYKPGGLGAAATFGLLIPTPYTDKELVDAFELGFKRQWYFGDQSLTTNAVAFYYDYQGYQVPNQIVPEDPDGAGPLPRPPAYTTYVNLPKVETTGFELETIWAPTENLRFLFNYGYTNPEIQDSGDALVHSLDPRALDPAAQPLGAPLPLSTADAASCTNLGVNCAPIQGQSVAGNILPSSPKNKIALNATYDWVFENGSRLTPSISYFWQDISYNSIFNRQYTKVPSWDQTDARLSWTSSEGNVTLIGFVRNVFDEDAYDNKSYGLRQGNQRDIRPGVCGSTALNTVSHAANPLGVLAQDCYTITNTYRPPRTYGAELQFRF